MGFLFFDETLNRYEIIGIECQLVHRGDFTLTLANAAHVKNVPGRKTDVNDASSERLS